MSGDKPPKIVERKQIAVMFRRTTDVQQSITRTWAEVEIVVGSLKGRKFYGAFDATTREYWVCVKREEGDEPGALGLEEGVLPGGRYARVRLKGDPPAVHGLIRPAFERLWERSDADPSRPSIEFYRRSDEIDLLLPIG